MCVICIYANIVAYFWCASSPLCFVQYNSKELGVLYLQSNTTIFASIITRRIL